MNVIFSSCLKIVSAVDSVEYEAREPEYVWRVRLKVTQEMMWDVGFFFEGKFPLT
jgi:hypothetical protein